jgi:hypothetical protein
MSKMLFMQTKSFLKIRDKVCVQICCPPVTTFLSMQVRNRAPVKEVCAKIITPDGRLKTSSFRLQHPSVLEAKQQFSKDLVASVNLYLGKKKE